jgi:hypothetical protein
MAAPAAEAFNDEGRGSAALTDAINTRRVYIHDSVRTISGYYSQLQTARPIDIRKNYDKFFRGATGIRMRTKAAIGALFRQIDMLKEGIDECMKVEEISSKILQLTQQAQVGSLTGLSVEAIQKEIAEDGSLLDDIGMPDYMQSVYGIHSRRARLPIGPPAGGRQRTKKNIRSRRHRK